MSRESVIFLIYTKTIRRVLLEIINIVYKALLYSFLVGMCVFHHESSISSKRLVTASLEAFRLLLFDCTIPPVIEVILPLHPRIKFQSYYSFNFILLLSYFVDIYDIMST